MDFQLDAIAQQQINSKPTPIALKDFTLLPAIWQPFESCQEMVASGTCWWTQRFTLPAQLIKY